MEFDRRKNTLSFDVSEALDAIGVDEILEYFGANKFLDAIGRQDCVDYFGIEEDER